MEKYINPEIVAQIAIKTEYTYNLLKNLLEQDPKLKEQLPQLHQKSIEDTKHFLTLIQQLNPLWTPEKWDSYVKTLQ